MAKLSILCVEDDPDIREILQLALELDGGAEVQCCGTGREALDLTRHAHFDVILLDVMMPGLDGPATLKCLQQAPGTAATPVIFVTAKATRDELNRLTGQGALGVVCKPLDPVTLLARVQEFLAAGNLLPVQHDQAANGSMGEAV